MLMNLLQILCVHLQGVYTEQRGIGFKSLSLQMQLEQNKGFNAFIQQSLKSEIIRLQSLVSK